MDASTEASSVDTGLEKREAAMLQGTSEEQPHTEKCEDAAPVIAENDTQQPTSEKVAHEISDETTKRPGMNDEDDNIEYPSSWRLALITIALCLSVFCMALVRTLSLRWEMQFRQFLFLSSQWNWVLNVAN
jgi:hypothetical protein